MKCLDVENARKIEKKIEIKRLNCNIYNKGAQFNHTLRTYVFPSRNRARSAHNFDLLATSLYHHWIYLKWLKAFDAYRSRVNERRTY